MSAQMVKEALSSPVDIKDEHIVQVSRGFCGAIERPITAKDEQLVALTWVQLTGMCSALQ